MKRKPLTIQAMAKKAGVSVATISRAMNPETRHKVAPETLARVESLVRRLGYTPNLAAKQLRKSSYKTIGLVFPHYPGILSSEYYSELLSGAADALFESEYRLKMVLLKSRESLWDDYDFRQGESVDGLILTYWRSVFTSASVFENMKIPCAVVNNVEKNVRVHYVAADHFEGGRMAARFLCGKGHRSVAVFSGANGAPDALDRLRGFKAGLKEHGVSLPAPLLFDTRFEEEKAYAMTDELVRLRPAVTAVFCMNDTLAHGVLRRLKELKVSCPGKISVMGYDDDRRSEHSEPPLTTLRAPVYELGRRAAQDLVERLNNKESEAFYTPSILPVTLEERESVSAV